MPLDLDVVRENVAAARAAIDEAAARAGRPAGSVELLAATKYVAPEDMPLLAEAGIELVGENRTDALAAKQALHADRFTWDFIGALQSRKARDVVDRVRLVHALESLSAAEQLARRAERDVACLVEVGIAGEAQKAGVPPGELEAFLEACAPLERLRIEGLMTMPPLADDPERSRSALRGAPRAGLDARAALRRKVHVRAPLDGHVAGLRGRRGGGRDDRPAGFRAVRPTGRVGFAAMGVGDMWHRGLVYFGLAEDEDWYDDDEDGSAAHDDLERTYRERPNVRRIDRQRGRGQVEVEDIFPDEDLPRASRGRASRRSDGGASTAVLRPAEVRAARAAGEIAKVHLIAPRSFNDAQQIADRFKRDIPVIINLQNSDAGARQAPDRLRVGAHVRARRRHAARRRQGVPAHATRCRALGGGSRALPRGRVLQPGLTGGERSMPPTER